MAANKGATKPRKTPPGEGGGVGVGRGCEVLERSCHAFLCLHGLLALHMCECAGGPGWKPTRLGARTVMDKLLLSFHMRCLISHSSSRR